jgi:hypothetical protein
MEKNSLKFNEKWYTAIKDLPPVIQSEIFTAIMEYGLYGIETELKPTARAVFLLVKQDMDREAKRAENGRKGGLKAQKTPEPAKPRAKPVARTLQSKAKEIFEEHCKKVYGADYYWAAKDAGAMSQLLKKLRYALDARGKPTDDEQILATLKSFLEAIQDDWIHEHLSVSIINSKYNEIVNQIKTVRYGHNNTTGSAKRGANQDAFINLTHDIAQHRQGVVDEGEKPY